MGPTDALDPPEATTPEGRSEYFSHSTGGTLLAHSPGCQAVPMGRMEGTSGGVIGEALGETLASSERQQANQNVTLSVCSLGPG